MEVFSTEYTLLAMQCALLGEVIPELRAVLVNMDKDELLLYIYFYYDGEVSEERIDLWDCAIAEASTDSGPEFWVVPKIERLDYPQKIPPKGYYAYLRKELDTPSHKECPKAKIAERSLGYAMLAVQYALLGLVTPELRAVIVDFEKEEPSLFVRFYYNGEVPEKLIDLWNSAIKEASLDLGPNCLLDGKVERVDYPETYPFRGRLAYSRKE